MRRIKSIVSLFFLVLLVWNLAGWWLYPISSSIFSNTFSGEACCNGAEICCCTSAGADACYCLPSEIHDDSENSDKTLVCGISSPDDRNHTNEKGTFTFLDIRVCIPAISLCSPFLHSTRTLPSLISFLHSAYLSDVLRPPEFV